MTSKPRRRYIPKHFTPEQKAFARAVRGTDKNIVLRATAGSGKTTTATFAAHLLKPDVRAAYFVYNRHNVAGVQQRLPAHVEALTLHAQGFRICSEHLGEFKVDKDSNLDMVRRVNVRASLGFPAIKHRSLLKLWNTARDSFFVIETEDQLRWALRGIAGLEEYLIGQNLEKNVRLFQRFLESMIDQSLKDCRAGRAPDFTDLLFWPLMLGWSRNLYDVVLIDEAQDLTLLRQSFALSMIQGASGDELMGRFIAVGDTDQSIYQYANASPELFTALSTRDNTVTMPLSVSFRLPHSHIRQAQVVSDFISASDAAKAGHVEHGRALEMTFGRGDTVLCRVNAPLVQLALRLLERGVSVDVRGLDIETRLMRYGEVLAQGFTAESLPDLLDEGFRQAKQPLEVLVAEGDKQAGVLIAELRDLHACLQLLGEKVLVGRQRASLREVRAYFFSLYREGADVLLSSVHKAKGLEWPRVTVLYPELMPLPYGDEDEERCVAFVAVTRAQDTLRFAYGEKAWADGWRWGMSRTHAPDWVLPDPEVAEPDVAEAEAVQPPNLTLPPVDVIEEIFGVAPVVQGPGSVAWIQQQQEARFAGYHALSTGANQVLVPDPSVPVLSPGLSPALHASRVRLAERQRELLLRRQRATGRAALVSFDEPSHTVALAGLKGLLRSLGRGVWRAGALWAYAALDELEDLPDEVKDIYMPQTLYSTLQKFSIPSVRYLSTVPAVGPVGAFAICPHHINYRFFGVEEVGRRGEQPLYSVTLNGVSQVSAVHPVTLAFESVPHVHLFDDKPTVALRELESRPGADVERFTALNLPCPLLPYVRSTEPPVVLPAVLKQPLSAPAPNIVFPALG